MSWMDFLVQFTRAVATPVAALVAVYWFKSEIKRLLDAVTYFIKERKFKTRFPGVSVEVSGPESEEIRRTRERIEAAPKPPDASTEVQDVIEARKFVLRDERGKAHAEIGLIDDDGKSFPAFRIFDAEGRTRIYMGLSSEHDAVLFVESPNGSSAGIQGSDITGPLLVLSGPDQKAFTLLDLNSLYLAAGRAFIGAAEEGPGHLLLRDTNGENTFTAP